MKMVDAMLCRTEGNCLDKTSKIIDHTSRSVSDILDIFATANRLI